MKNGKIVEIKDGKKHVFYYKDDLLHREKGPAAVYYNGTKTWYKEGKKHRVGAPASLWNNGNIEWFFEGLRHCETGPALIYSGRKEEYYIMGVQYSKEDYPIAIMKWLLHQKLTLELDEKPKTKKPKI